MSYTAPIADMRFVLEEVAGIGGIAALPGYEAADPDLIEAILGEAAKFASRELAPLNQPADQRRQRPRKRRGAHARRVPRGLCPLCRRRLERACRRPGIRRPGPAVGARHRRSRRCGTRRAWRFALCPLLTARARSSCCGLRLATSRSSAISAGWSRGEWTGTMNLTEPQAGSDLGALTTRAVPAHDPQWGEHYRITGQKIFITYGDHDLTPQHCPCRCWRAPPARRRAAAASRCSWCRNSCPTTDGRPGQRNDIRTLGLEHKLGIHASPTCVLAYGEDGAIGWRVGEENRGLEYMFTMMNNARLNIGVQGLAIAERAYQQARDFARTRVQGRPLGAPGDGEPLPIIHHPDVRRMLLSMRARPRRCARSPITPRRRSTAPAAIPTRTARRARNAAPIC